MPNSICNLFEEDEILALKEASKFVMKLDNVKSNEDRFEEIRQRVESDLSHLHINIFDEAHHSATNQGEFQFLKSKSITKCCHKKYEN